MVEMKRSLLVAFALTAALASISFGNTITIPEGSPLNPEETTFTVPGFKFGNNNVKAAVLKDCLKVGPVLTCVPSDVILFGDVLGTATFTFISDPDPLALLPPGVPIVITKREPRLLTLNLLPIGGGSKVPLIFCSDVETGTTTCGGSDSVTSSARIKPQVPEPGTLALFGLGLVGAGVQLRRRRKAL